MRKLFTILACAALTLVSAEVVSAQDLQGRVAVTGRLGAILPADSTENVPAGKLIVDTDTGFIGGGGILFGVNNDVAIEMDITHATYGTKSWGDADLTTLSFSGQYRFPERNSLQPYVAAGVDVLIPDLPSHSVDTVVGLHLAGGIDYFLTRQLAMNVELKGVEAFEADVRAYDGSKVGDFDPTHVAVTVGARFFFN